MDFLEPVIEPNAEVSPCRTLSCRHHKIRSTTEFGNVMTSDNQD